MPRTLRRSLILLVLLASTTAVQAQSIEDIHLNEVDPRNNWVELRNNGLAPIDVSDFILCTFPTYSAISDLTIRAGSTTIEPGLFVVVQWDPKRDADADATTIDGEVGLYRPGSSGSFDDADNLVDYLAFGASQASARAPVAVEAGLWSAPDVFAEMVPEGFTLAFFDGFETREESWGQGDPTENGPNQPLSSDVDDPEVPTGYTLSAVFPNPFNPEAQLTLTLAQPQHVAVEVYDLLGRHVETLFTGVLGTAGEHRFTFEAGTLPSGLYLVQVAGETFTATRRAMLLK